MRRFVGCLLLILAMTAHADDALQFSGIVLLRAASAPERGALQMDDASAQVQLGIDWTPDPRLNAHVHLLGRTETDQGTRRGNAGVVEAYLEGNFRPRGDRVRIRAGAMFLPGTKENVDALWESPYAISSSALTSWLGEEMRPIGVDATWFHRGAMVGATLYRGNDTLGALPAVRGWTLDDHWTLLGEWIPVDPEYFTSVSAETDHRLGWAARGGWSGQNLSVTLSHFDNRSDGLEYGELFNWGTRFTTAGFDYTRGDWTLAGESGWGPTFLIVHANTYVTDLRATYLLASRQWRRVRTTLRAERYEGGPWSDHAVTVAVLANAGKLRPGVEITRAGDDTRVLAELRYSF